MIIYIYKFNACRSGNENLVKYIIEHIVQILVKILTLIQHSYFI